MLKVVERGFAALAAITKTWEASSASEALEHDDRKWESAQAVIARTFATLLYQAWAVSVQSIVSLCILHLPMLFWKRYVNIIHCSLVFIMLIRIQQIEVHHHLYHV